MSLLTGFFLECKTKKLNSQCEHGQPMEQTRGVFSTCGSLSSTTPVPLLANAFDFQSVLHGHVSLAAVNQICFIHEVIFTFPLRVFK